MAGWRRPVVLVACLVVAACSASDSNARSAIAATPTPTTQAPAPTAAVRPTVAPAPSATAVEALRLPPIPKPGELILEPEGPYRQGDTVTAYANAAQLADVWNIGPRFCARVDSGPEYCGPQGLHARETDQAFGLVWTTFELPRLHFGPAGYQDCASGNVVCRVALQNKDDGAEATPPLEYIGSIESPANKIVVTPGSSPGRFVIEADIDTSDPANLLPHGGLDFLPRDSFNPDRLTFDFRIGNVCSFAPGSAPIGSEKLAEWPDWWGVLERWGGALGGPNCDWRAISPAGDIDPTNGPVEVTISRSIYGFQGWSDCGATPCFVSIDMRYMYAMPDGSTLGADLALGYALLPTSTDWPQSQLPSLIITTPPPFELGQVITVEARNAPTHDNLVIGQCIGAGQCVYYPQTTTDGIATLSWTISQTCAPNRCYFAINSRSEGLPPPVVAVIEVAE